MATQGCTQLTAVNFDPTSTIWDYSCNYIYKIWDTVSQSYKCIWFRDIENTNMKSQSFTLSYSIEAQNWVFYHDYLPDFYFHTRENLFNLKAQDNYRHHNGTFGTYHKSLEGPQEVKSFFIDVVFRTDSDLLLETVNWMSTVSDSAEDLSTRDSEWSTLTHITIWNSQQHTGRISLSDIFKDLQYNTSRKTKGSWSMNDFRNILSSRGNQFILDLFEDYKLDTSFVSSKAWHQKELIEDKYIIVRFEFDNSVQKQLILHDTTIQAQKTNR